MTAFRVGQRVKRTTNPGDQTLGPKVGEEGVVSHNADGLVWVVFDHPVPWFGGASFRPYGCELGTIVPLTDHAADAWATEQVRKWTKPEATIPLVVKERA